MDLFEHVSKKIHELRTNYGSGKGLSQEALAKELDVVTNTISRWETGTYKPDLADLEKLAKFFGVSITEFFPKDKAPENDSVNSLLITAKKLNPADIEEVRRFAEFRHMNNVYKDGVRPRTGRKRKNSQ